MRTVSLLPCPWARQQTWDIAADPGFLCDEAAVTGDTTNETPIIYNSSEGNVSLSAIRHSQNSTIERSHGNCVYSLRFYPLTMSHFKLFAA
jgi:hypothetical protein